MKKLIKQVLREETLNPERIAKTYLDQLNLEPWEDVRHGMQYLVVPNSGQIIFLLINKEFSCSILGHFYKVLNIIFKSDEERMNKFVFSYLKYNGLTPDFNIIDFWTEDCPDTGVARIEDGDTPIMKYRINEGRKPKLETQFVKSWLSRFDDLKKYKSGDGRYIYLTDKSGQILVSLDTQINETGVSDEMIFEPIENVVGEKMARRKIISWLLNKYHLVDMGYVLSIKQERLGTISNDTIPYEQETINESEEKSKLERFFIKRWDDQKKRGIVPNILDLHLMGLQSHRDEILQYFIKYMNIENENSRSQVVKKYLLGNIFTEKQMNLMSEYFDKGRITIKFDNVEFYENETYGGIDLDIEFVVLDGSFRDENGVMVNFSSNEVPIDDMMELFEFKDYVKDVVGGLVSNVLNSFGYNINKDFSDINIEWQ